MALYFSRRACIEHVGVDLSDGIVERTRTRSAGGSAEIKAMIASAHMQGGNVDVEKRSLSISDPDLHEQLLTLLKRSPSVRVKRIAVEIDDELQQGDILYGTVDQWRQGCVPIFAINGSQKYSSTAYMATGLVQVGETFWIRLLRSLRGRPLRKRSVRIQAFGTADNYTRWNPEDRECRVSAEGWYPSSPEGLITLIALDQEISEEDYQGEKSLESKYDLRSEGALSLKFDDILGGRFNNSHMSGRSGAKVDIVDSTRPPYIHDCSR